jgi:hypothetical protein
MRHKTKRPRERDIASKAPIAFTGVYQEKAHTVFSLFSFLIFFINVLIFTNGLCIISL